MHVAALPRRLEHLRHRSLIVAIGVNTEGQREVLGLKVGASEAKPFWTEFLRSLDRRDLRGVRLVISDSQEGLKRLPASRTTPT